jgi:lipoprotein-anchoring transpeptidase ErfK/SrfK
VNKRLVIGISVVVLAVLLGINFSRHKTQPKEPPSPSAQAVKELYAQASHFKKNRDMLKAKNLYQEILTKYPDAENITTVQKESDELNIQLLFSNAEVPGKTVIHEVAAGDSLTKIAKKYGVTLDLIKRSNNLKSDVISVGQKLRIWTGKFSVLVDKSQNILILKDGNDVLKVYSVSTGENNSTPVGTFKITSKLVNPVWFNKGLVIPPESPENVLGTRWLGFDLQGYGIHGTVEPQTIGQQVTAGCVRMRNEEVEELYSILPMGTEVTITD